MVRSRTQIELRGDIRDAQPVVPLGDELAKGVGESERVLRIDMNHEGGEAFRKPGQIGRLSPVKGT